MILVHDEGQDSAAWSALVGELSGQGFRVLAFDLRGYGASDGPRNAGQAPADVSAALSFARSQGASSLYLVGAGAGANAALIAARAYSVAAAVVLSPRAGPSGAPRGTVEETRAPKLIIAGSLDDPAAAQAAEVFRRSIGWAVLDSTPVKAQGTDLLRSAWGEQVRGNIVAFLLDYF